MQTLHCKAILLNLPCKIKCFYRKFCRSYTTPAKFYFVSGNQALVRPAMIWSAMFLGTGS